MQKKNQVASHTTQMPKPKSPYDWATIKDEYIKNGMCFADIERKYKMNHSTLYRKAKKEQWEQMRNEIATRSKEKTIEKISDARSSINEIAMRALRIIAEKTEQGLAEADLHDSRAIKDYMSIMKDLKDIGAISVETETSDVLVSFESGDDYGN